MQIGDISIIRDFNNIFSNDLSRVSPDKEIELHAIKLMKGLRLI